MHRKLFAFVFVAALLSSAVVVFADSDSSDAAVPTTVDGYLGMSGSPNVPAAGVQIMMTNMAESITPVPVSVNAETGFFTVDLSTTPLSGETEIRIYFSEVDYFAHNLLPGLSRISNSTHLKLDLNEFTDECHLGVGSVDYGILLGVGHGNLEFTVKGTERFLWNAMISLDSTTSADEYSGQTGGDGKYTFNDLPYGIYKLKVTCNGYQAYYEEDFTYTGQAVKTVTLTEKVIPTFYGMTTYHALMFVGVAVGLILVLISYIMVRRNSKGIED